MGYGERGTGNGGRGTRDGVQDKRGNGETGRGGTGRGGAGEGAREGEGGIEQSNYRTIEQSNFE